MRQRVAIREQIRRGNADAKQLVVEIRFALAHAAATHFINAHAKRLKAADAPLAIAGGAVP